MPKTILIVDDEPAILETLAETLRDEGYGVLVASTGEAAVKKVQESLPALVLLDVWMPGMDGIETLRQIVELHPTLSVIVMSGHASIEAAVQAIKLGAYDFVEKPLFSERVVRMVKHALEEQRLAEENRNLWRQVEQRHLMIGESPAMRQLYEQMEKAAPTESRIFISGENGTGKELVARAIHAKSSRRIGPFVDINCAAIPESLIESELFGYEKGAFTGADRQKRGRFEEAMGGTLFLDEIGDMALSTQSRLLRVLQESAFHRVGGGGMPITVDLRVIAASNKNLEEAIQKGGFREDLYHRLNVIRLSVPPLRERTSDIPLLAGHFIKEMANKQGMKPKKITPEAMDLLKQYAWPGNVRELRNVVERFMILVSGDRILPQDVPLLMGQPVPAGTFDPSTFDSLGEARHHFEREFILRKLSQHNWNISQTASDLKIERTHLHRKMKGLRIQPPKD